MRKITVDDIMALRPCSEYTRARVEWLLGGKKALSLMKILVLSIPYRDIIWAVLAFLTPEQLVLFARWCALRVASFWDCPSDVLHWLETGEGGIYWIEDLCYNEHKQAYLRWVDADADTVNEARAAEAASGVTLRATQVVRNAVPVNLLVAKRQTYFMAHDIANFIFISEKCEHRKQIEKLKELVSR